MSVSKIREELHQFINEADDDTVNRIYGLIHAERETLPLLTEEQRIDLDKRIERYERGETTLLTWQEARQEIENKKR